MGKEPVTLARLLPTVPRQRRSGARSGPMSVQQPETQSGSFSEGVTASSQRDNLRLRLSRQEAPQPNRSLHQLLSAKIQAQNLDLQRDKVIHQLQQQLKDEGRTSASPSMPSRRPLEGSASKKEWLDRIEQVVRQHLEMVGLIKDWPSACDPRARQLSATSSAASNSVALSSSAEVISPARQSARPSTVGFDSTTLYRHP